MRIDVWLNLVLLFKTRSSAAEAVKAGDVLLNGNAAKPAAIIKINDIIDIDYIDHKKKVKVIAIPQTKSVARKDRFLYFEELS